MRTREAGLEVGVRASVLVHDCAAHDYIALNRDQEKTEKIVRTLELKVLPRDLKAKDPATLLTAIFSQWLPLASCTFSALVSNVPSPQEAQAVRVPKLLRPDLPYFASAAELAPQDQVQADVFEGRAGREAHSVAYVSKMLAVRRADLPEGKQKALTAEEMRARAKESRERARAIAAATVAAVAAAEGGEADAPAAAAKENGDAAPEGMSLEEAQQRREGALKEAEEAKAAQVAKAQAENEESPSEEVVIAFSRLYSGSLRVGQSVLVMLLKYDAALDAANPSNAKQIKVANIDALYMIMGRELIAVQDVPAGIVFGIRGLEGALLRNATPFTPPEDNPPEDKLNGQDLISWVIVNPTEAKSILNLAGFHATAAPIVRLALEPKSPSDMPQLMKGLTLLD